MKLSPHLNLFRNRPRHPLRHQKALHSCSDDLPPSTSEDNSEQYRVSKSQTVVHHPSKSEKIPYFDPKSENLSYSADGEKTGPVSTSEKFALTHLVRSDSQTSIDSVKSIVREKEEKWKQRHQNSVKRKVRIQTLI